MTTVTEAAVDVRNPYTGEVLGHVPVCGPDEVDAACASAAAYLRADDFPQHRRAEVLQAASTLVGQRTESLAQLICAESGKPIRAARAEVDRCVDTLRYSAIEAATLAGEMVPAAGSRFGQDRIMFTIPVPVGVVAAITPFNFPLNLVAHKVGPAIAAGCPVVLKPSWQAPLSALALVDLLVEAGMPPGWIGVVTDSGSQAGAALVRHPVPRFVTFTGSAAVGWSIAAAAPKKRVALELGSTAPVIVEPDADLDAVVARATAGAFGFAGQSCISLQRVLVHRDVHAQLRDRLAAAAGELVAGDPADERTDVGPLIEARHTERVRQWIAEAAEQGARVVAGGRLDGVVLRPTVVDAPVVGTRLWREEVFGPVLAVHPYQDFDEALDLANDTELAIHAGIFTADLAKAMRAVRRLDFAGVLVNEVPTQRVDMQPYGGLREAGNTREGPHYVVREMTEFRCVSLPAG
jgi:acyl-CoA reductase-like NAD-dependent aldehyde dehydrogenase